MSDQDPNYSWKIRVKAAEREIEKAEAETLKWSNIAYDLACALIDEMIDGSDGPPKPVCWPPCECSTHKALEAWGNAQAELLDRIDPEWKDRMYGIQ